MHHSEAIQVLIVDDHPLFRKGASQLIDLDDRFVLSGEATGGYQGVDLAISLKPDLILLDLNMDDMDGIHTLKTMRDSGVKSKIIMLTVSNDEKDLVTAMRNGANGYLLKDMEPENLLEELIKAASGQIALSPELTNLLITSLQQDNQSHSLEDASLTNREEQILVLIAKGMNNKLIGRKLEITEGTVKVHVKNLLRKLNLSSRLEAAVWAIENKISG